MYQWPPGRLLLEHCTGGRRRRHCRWSSPSSHHLVSLSSWGCAAISSGILIPRVVTFGPGNRGEGPRRHLNPPHEWEDGGKTLASCVYAELTATVVESREKRRRLSRSLEFPVAMATWCLFAGHRRTRWTGVSSLSVRLSGRHYQRALASSMTYAVPARCDFV